MGKLIIMCGIPGSGKTTFVKKQLSPELLDIYISRDEIRYSMVKPDEEYFSKENAVFNEFCYQINKALLTSARFVVADATHLNRKSRAKLLERIKGEHEKIAIFMDVTLETALKRNALRSGRAKVPESAIKSMYESMEEPQLSEGFKKILYVNEKGKIEEGNLI